MATSSTTLSGDESKWTEAQKLASLEPAFRAKVQPSGSHSNCL